MVSNNSPEVQTWSLHHAASSPLAPPFAHLPAELSNLHDRDLHRVLPATWRDGRIPSREACTLHNFASNDYLGLSHHDRVVERTQRALKNYGCGVGSSRLLSGDLHLHHELEVLLAQLTQQQAALLFPSGYQANIATIAALAGRGDIIYSDALNHASLIDGARLSRANIRIFRHCDMDHLDWLLSEEPEAGRRFIISETLFSMDGDLAPVSALQALSREHHAALILDEAHAFGVFGQGAGLALSQGVKADVTLATLSKSLGSGGGFVASSSTVIEWLINKARGFIYSTGITPANVIAAHEALSLVLENRSLGTRLLSLAGIFRQRLQIAGLPVPAGESQIVPLRAGTNDAALMLAHELQQHGIFSPAIRPPTVPEGTARLRFSVTLDHEPDTLAECADKVIQTWQTLPQ